MHQCNHKTAKLQSHEIPAVKWQLSTPSLRGELVRYTLAQCVLLSRADEPCVALSIVIALA